jgi:DNA-binding transcriptional ArsR family regulator
MESEAAIFHIPLEEASVVRGLAALAQPSRLRAFRALVIAGRQGLTPGALCEELDVAATTLSFHLKELTRAGLVSQERDGRHLIYRASFDRMNLLLDYLTAHCCAGESCGVPAACCPPPDREIRR